MIQRASPEYQVRLFLKCEEGGFWHRHAQGADPEKFRQNRRVTSKVTVVPHVNESRWIVKCPFCPGAQLAHPDTPAFFCVDCCNAAVKGAWVKVDWPSPEFVHAIESVLEARPEFANRNWFPDESVGALLAENVMAGLIEGDAAAGDIGHDQAALASGGLIKIGPGLPALGER